MGGFRDTGELLRRVKRAGCVFVEHGGGHDIYVNPINGKRTTIPRHRKIKDGTYRAILKQLGID